MMNMAEGRYIDVKEVRRGIGLFVSTYQGYKERNPAHHDEHGCVKKMESRECEVYGYIFTLPWV